MLWGRSSCPTIGVMEKVAVKTAKEGEPSILVINLPAELGDDQIFGLPLLKRATGLLVLVPEGVIPLEALEAGQTADEEALLGPSCSVSVELGEEEEASGQELRTGVTVSALCADFNDEILLYAREFDPVTDSAEVVVTFDPSRPTALPFASEVLETAIAWAEESAGRSSFYSAREEQVAPAKKATRRPLPSVSQMQAW